MANFDPLSFQQIVDSAGAPAASAKLYYYETGTTTPKAVYSNAALSSAITQPVRADANGVVPVVYMIAGRYKRAVTTSADVTISAYAADPIDASVEMLTAAAAPSPTYPFLRYYNTDDGHVYERNHTDSGWTDLGLVDSLLNAASVTQQLTGTSAALSSTPDSVAALWQRGTSITPSGGTVSLPSTGGGVYTINAGNFSAISSAQGGRIVVFEFAGASVITHNASSMDLPGNANITTAAGDRAAFVNLAAQDASGSNWRMLWLARDDGSIAFVVATQAQMETGTNLTFPVTPGVVKYSSGTAKAYAKWDATTNLDVSYNVTSLTDVTTGTTQLNFTTAFSTANYSGAGLAQRVASNDSLWLAIKRTTNPSTTALRIVQTLEGALLEDAAYANCSVDGDQ